MELAAGDQRTKSELYCGELSSRCYIPRMKQRISIELDTELVVRIEALGLNLSTVVSQSLSEAVRRKVDLSGVSSCVRGAPYGVNGLRDDESWQPLIQRYVDSSKVDLPSNDMDVLRSAGLDVTRLYGTVDEILSSIPAIDRSGIMTDVLSSCVPMHEVVDHLVLSGRELIERIEERSLVAIFIEGGKLAFPLFQFTIDGELPGLRQILPAFPPSAPLTTIITVFDTPQDELINELGVPMTPSQWLKSGGDPAPVVFLARYPTCL